jgi:hypothetical protein
MRMLTRWASASCALHGWHSSCWVNGGGSVGGIGRETGDMHGPWCCISSSAWSLHANANGNGKCLASPFLCSLHFSAPRIGSLVSAYSLPRTYEVSISCWFILYLFYLFLSTTKLWIVMVYYDMMKWSSSEFFLFCPTESSEFWLSEMLHFVLSKWQTLDRMTKEND